MRSACLAATALMLAGCASEAPEQSASEAVAQEPADAAVDTVSEGATEASKEAGVDATVSQTKVACSAHEEPLFSCTASNGKQIAVCSAGEGTIEYRYGKGEAELVLQKPEWASVAYSGGGEAQIAFANGDTRYIVFSRIVRTNFEPGEPNDPAISDGVVVQRGEEVLNVQACGGDGDLKPVDYNLAERLIPERKKELFTYETSRADPF